MKDEIVEIIKANVTKKHIPKAATECQFKVLLFDPHSCLWLSDRKYKYVKISSLLSHFSRSSNEYLFFLKALRSKHSILRF